MGLFSRNKEVVVIRETNTAESDILRSVMVDDTLTKEKIMNIPSISACVNKISDTVAGLKVKLYKRDGDAIVEIEDDKRVSLLNDDTRDTLDGFQFKKAMVVDMYLDKGGYAYIKRKGNEIESLHYVEPNNISFRSNSDCIFKDYKIVCQGKNYEGFDFIKLLRNTKDGYQGKSILKESPELLNIIYSSQLYEKNLVKTGGNKKGFIQSTVKLTREAMTALKDAFRNLYSNNTENVVVLNDGLTFKESTNTSTEMQLNENKHTNSDDVCKIFLIPPPILNGGATESDRKSFTEDCILPVLERFATALNREMLTEDEKSSLFYAFDTTDLVKGDIEKRFKSYEIAIKNGFMQVDEVRKQERLPSFDLNFVKLGLQDVLYFPDSDEVYTPNTNKKVAINAQNQLEEGGETEDES